MGLVARLVTLPVSAPIRGSLWLARKVHEAAAQEFYDPGAIRAKLARLEAQLLAGEISEDAYDAAELALLERLKEVRA
mgnify:CR=1 FL=1